MKHIDQHIVELVLRYENVILPKMGCLTKSISFSTDKNHTFSKEEHLIFEQSSKLDDGMLYKYVSLKQHISLTEAQKIVDQYIYNLKVRVFNQEEVTLPPLGSFSLSENETIEFNYNKNFRIYPEYNGLTSFSRQPIIRQVELKAEHTQKKSRAWYWATAAIVPLLGLSIYFGINRQQLNDSAIPTTAGLSEISTSTFSTIDLSLLEEVNFEGLYEESEEIISFTKAKPIITKGYQIVLGVFGDKANANKLANQFKNEMVIAPYKGMFKVSTTPYASKKEAQGELSLIRKTYPKAWLLKLK